MITTPSWYTATPSPIHPTDVPSVSLGAAITITQLFALGLTGVTSYSPTIFAPLVLLPVLIELACAVGLLLMIDPLISLSLLF